jgi:signal transduction histidine kinase
MIGLVLIMQTVFKKLRRKITHLSLYYKINILVVGMILACGLLIGGIMLQTTAQLFENQLDKRGIEIANSIASLSSNDILLDDHFSISERLNKTKSNNEEVRYILVTDSTGHILANTFTNSLPKGLPPIRLPANPAAPLVSGFNSNEGFIREVLFPIENGSIGFVRIGMSENISQLLLKEKLTEIIFTILIVCVLAALGATRLSYMLVQPIRFLSEAAYQIQQGNYNIHTRVPSKDETGKLAAAFNAMVSSLRSKDRENNKLLQEIHTKEALRASLIKKLFTVREDEQRRLSRELHDEIGQSMASLLAYMKVLHAKLVTHEQKALLVEARDVTVAVLEGLRKMAVELRPPALDYLGIMTVLERYTANFSVQYEITVCFEGPKEKISVSNDVALSLYRILQESLTNIIRHAKADQVKVHVTKNPKSICMEICDNGQGFQADFLEVARSNNRLGLFGMQERAEMLGGSFEIRSTVDRGTTIIAILPIGSDNFVKTENTFGG